MLSYHRMRGYICWQLFLRLLSVIFAATIIISGMRSQEDVLFWQQQVANHNSYAKQNACPGGLNCTSIDCNKMHEPTAWLPLYVSFFLCSLLLFQLVSFYAYKGVLFYCISCLNSFFLSCSLLLLQLVSLLINVYCFIVFLV